MTTPDFHLTGFLPADPSSQEAHDALWPPDCTVLAQHHTADGARSYLVLHDTSATWGIPGEPQLIAAVVTRDPATATFRFETSRHATMPFAQNWLIQHGCPAEEILLPEGVFPRAADELTVRIEEQIRTSGARYPFLDSYTHDDAGAFEAWTTVRDTSPAAAVLPVRLFLEQADADGTYTIREGAFANEDAAEEWLFNRDAPLPAPPEHRNADALRHRAALARSTTALAPSAATAAPGPAVASAAGRRTR